MALSCPIGLDVKLLRKEIGEIYSRVASDPAGDFHFHRGPEYAARLLGYSASATRPVRPQRSDGARPT